MRGSTPRGRGVLRAVGLGLITGAADDDPSAIGTYVAAGASLGPAFLWVGPAMFPMMFAVVYLSSKLGQVAGKGLFAVIRDFYPRWIMYPALIGVIISNTFEAGADIGGIAAALNGFVPIPFSWTVVGTAAGIVALQVWGSYVLIRNVFRWLALALLAYVGAAIAAAPDILPIVLGTFVPTLRFDREFLAMVVAVVGTSLSAYLYTWQSNEEVEEEIAMGRTREAQRRGATEQELDHSRRDILVGMFFSNLVMYFVILSSAATLFRNGQHEVNTAAEAAQALRPLVGDAAGLLFAIGLIGVGALAVPVMTSGAAYSLAQAAGWRYGLHARPHQARKFYLAIAALTLLGAAMNFLGFNPMKVLVWSAVLQGLTTPPLMLLMMFMTNNRAVMGEQVNGRAINLLGWLTTAGIFAASLGLIGVWLT